MRKIKKTQIGLITLILFCSLPNNAALSWDDKFTHKDLSKYAVESSVLGSKEGDCLKNLGLANGLETSLKWNEEKSITQWLQEGAEREDAGSNLQGLTGMARYINHFHNPLKPWGSAGLNDLGYTGQSTILWSQYGSWQAGYIEGDWSWKKARDSFYFALTSKTDVDRQASFAHTFRALGHQIHLIQDMSVPAHVRNDAHPEETLEISPLTGDYYFETWAKKNSVLINAYASTPVLPAVDLNKSINGFVPISQFIDTEQYDGNVSPSTTPAWGLAEYTNSNFLSTDTIFTENYNFSDGHYFPYPRYVGQIQCYEQFKLADSTYWKKKCPGEPIEYFVEVGPLYKYAWSWDLQRRAMHLTSVTHDSYAQKLIPRAVGYSAALINYFFRGDLDMVSDDAAGLGFVIVNNADEEMNGKFELWYDNKNNERVKAWSGDMQIGKKSSGNNKSSNMAFTAPSDSKEPERYMLVFRGKLGAEDDAVAGKEISLMPLLIFLHNDLGTLFMTFDQNLNLKPYPPFNLNIMNAGLSGYETSPATIQSNEKFTKHYYMPSTTQDKKIPSIAFRSYGKVSPDKAPTYLLGDRNSFTPAGWDKDSPLEYNTDFGYLSYPSDYISSGRHNWINSGDSVIKNLEVWKETDGKPHVKYTTKDGLAIGNPLPFSDIYAVLSPYKVTGVSNEIGSENSTDATGADVYRTCNWGGWNYKRSTTGFDKNQSGHKFYFGDALIDYDGASRSLIWNIQNKIECSCGRYSSLFYDFAVTHYASDTRSSTLYSIQDYDNINDDDVFIIVYTKTGGGSKGESTSGDSVYDSYDIGMSPGPPTHSKTSSGSIRSYHIVYKLKNGNIQGNEICFTVNGTVEISNFTGNPCEASGRYWEVEDSTTWPADWQSSYSRTTQFQGQAIFNPSVKIYNYKEKVYITYSYSIYEYVGDPKVSNFDSELLSDWQFKKRIVGLINADTGQKKEIEITDTFLGDLYKGNFDKTIYSAIGFHNGGK